MSDALAVLIIEDCADDAVLLVRELQRGGFELTWQCIQTGPEMQAALERRAWDVILSDYKLPQFDGAAALELLQASGQDIPFLVVSGTVGEDVAVGMMRAGAHDYLMKGNLTRLPEAIRREIHQAHNRAARRQAEAALRESEAKFRSLFEELQDGVTLTYQGCIVAINQSMARLLGVADRQELMGRSLLDYMTPASRSQALAAIQKIHAGQIRANVAEFTYCRVDGSLVTAEMRGAAVDLGDKRYDLSVHHDITERKRTEQIIQARLRLFQFAATHALGELLQRTLDEVESLTGSLIGFYHFVHANQHTLFLQAWSTRTMREFCQAQGRGMHYPLEQAGVWADCARLRQPIIHNNYAELPNRKGMPPGHAEVVRELVVPILRNDQVVAILGVGNKPQDYTAQDVELVAYFADVAWEIAERKRAAEQIQASLREKETLLREIHHRVKNNMQVIVSLVGLQADGIHDPFVQALFQETQNRVRAMAFVHERLYESPNLAQLDFADYITRLAHHLFRVYRIDTNLVMLEIDVTPIGLDIDQAVSCGLILSELLSNCLKYAFPHLQAGEAFASQEPAAIHIHMRASDNQVTLSVGDNGVGLPPDLDWQHTTSLGMRLVMILTGQLGGTITLERAARGTVFTLTFPQSS